MRALPRRVRSWRPYCVPNVLHVAQVIDKFSGNDEILRRPVYVIGYYMMRRSTSVRGSRRVPTHAIIAPTSGLSLADLVQMGGRAAGNCRSILGAYSIVALMQEADFHAIRSYTRFVQELFR